MPRILIFDSGFGGLSIGRALAQRLPDASLICACDNEAFPYGLKSARSLMERVDQIFSRLVHYTQPDMAVIACNTASTVVLPQLRRRHAFPIVGVVPAVKPAASLSSSKVIALLATPATVEGEYLQQLVTDHAPHCTLITLGSMKLVELAEAKLHGTPPCSRLLRDSLSPLWEHPQSLQLDTVVLGCTHFSWLGEELARQAPRPFHWVDSTLAVTEQVAKLSRGMSPGCRRWSSDARVLLTSPARNARRLARRLNQLGFASLQHL